MNVGRALDDLDGDGYGDVVLEDALNSGDVLDVLLGGAQFDTVFDGRKDAPLSHPRFAGDLNADGFADLVGTVPADLSCGAGQSGYVVRIIYGAAAPEAARVEDLCRTAGTSSVMMFPGAVGDLDGDGFDDLGLARGFGAQNDFLIYAGGNAVSGSPIADVPGGTADYAFTRTAPVFAGGGDFDADSYPDVVVGEAENANPVEIHLLRGGKQLPGNFDDSINHPTCTSLIAIELAGDIDDDAHGDFSVLCSSASTNRFDLLPGGNRLALSAGLETTLPLAMASRAVDFNGDGKLEWFIASSNAEGPIIWDATAPDDVTKRLPSIGAAQVVQCADQDGDGRTDLTFFDRTAKPAWIGSGLSFSVSPLFVQPPNDVSGTNDLAY